MRATRRPVVAVLLFVLLAAAPPILAREAASGSDEPTPRFDPQLFQALQWRLVGPFRGGRSTAATGVVQDPFTYYFGTTGGGLWKTTDGGLSWRNVSDGHFATGSVGAVAVAPSDPNVVWVGMGESCVRGVMTTHGDGVYRSTDGGATWSHLGLDESRHIARVRVHPRDPDTAWVAAQGHLWGPNPERGVYKTTDGGETWRRVLFVDQDTGVSDLALDVTNPRVLYAATWQHRRRPWQIESGGPGSGLHKSTDGGETWERLTKGLPEPMGKVGVAVSPADSARVWAMIEADEGGLFRSDDAGASWRRVNDERVLRARAWYYTHVHAHPTNPDVVWVLNAPAMRSVDGGVSFERVATPHGDNHDLWIHPADPRFMINANDGGANVSWNAGASWTPQSNQPTAQFYRVATDDRFPYRIYGGQQDNTAIAIQSRSGDAAITGKHWHDIGGCESADPAFDPSDPRYVYAGCYQGLIDEWDAETGQTRSIMAYPQLNLSTDPAEMRYRFNWNAPIVVSSHDPSVIYHGANVVLRSTDRGTSWQAISPDLTRDQEDKQGAGGGPITNEGAGGEVYGTLLDLVESPHRAGVLWAGSDDGRVHLTRDDGATWSDVTPPDLGEAMVNAIEVSPHQPSAAYLAVTRYKWDDLRPEIYATVDFGATWRRLDAGLPEDLPVRVVREDPARRGLLYAGTEGGVFVSWDDGERWQPLELGLPTVPVTDLTLRRHDLVAATQGRAFWVLDDLTPLHHLDDDVASADLHLFPPRDAHLVPGGPGFRPPPSDAGTNPPGGVVVHYLVGAPEEDEEESAEDESGETEADETEADEPEPLVIEVFDADGRLVRRASSEKDEDAETADGGAAGERGGDKPLATRPGLNRWVWNLRYQAPADVPDTVAFGARGGPTVSAGTYRVRLSRGEVVQEHEVEVLPDPRSGLAAADYAGRRELVTTLRERLHQVHDTANRLHDAKVQVEAWVARLEERDGLEAVREAGEALAERLGELDEQLVQRQATNFQDVINYPPQLNAHYAFLLLQLDGSPPPVPAGVRQRLADLDVEWQALRAEVEKALGEELQGFDALLREHEVPAVLPPEPEPSMPEPSLRPSDS